LENKRALIFANGELKNGQVVKKIFQKEDIVIAADGGLRHILELDLKPDLVIGDLDSITSDQYVQLVEQEIPLQKFPPEKNETDLELALFHAIEIGCTSIWIIAGLGGRLDQTLGNIFLLVSEKLRMIDIRLFDGEEEVFLIRSSGKIFGKIGDMVSLVPMMGTVTGVRTQGLKYVLSDETLFPDKTRGISNELIHSSASVNIKTGTLLCIHQWNR
jgi:thiamine pyrophosphokinase